MWSSMVDGRTVQLYFEFAHTNTRKNIEEMIDIVTKFYPAFNEEIKDLSLPWMLMYSWLHPISENLVMYKTQNNSDLRKQTLDILQTFPKQYKKRSLMYKDKEWILVRKENLNNHNQLTTEAFTNKTPYYNSQVFKRACELLDSVRMFQFIYIGTSVLICDEGDSNSYNGPTVFTPLNVKCNVFGYVEDLLSGAARHWIYLLVKGLNLNIDRSLYSFIEEAFKNALLYFFYERIEEMSLDGLLSPEEQTYTKRHKLEMSHMLKEMEDVFRVKVEQIDEPILTEILMKNYPREDRFDVYATG